MATENKKEKRARRGWREDECYFQVNPYPQPSQNVPINSIECDDSGSGSSKNKQMASNNTMCMAYHISTVLYIH